MPQSNTSQDRNNLLADVAEMYYLEEKGQAEIAVTIGVTRSMVSRMLKQARQKGIIETRIHRTLRSDCELETALKDLFGLQGAYVVTLPNSAGGLVLSYLGAAGAQMLERYLSPGTTVGLSWGVSVSAAVHAFHAEKSMGLKVVQLVGARDARGVEYDGYALVLRLAEKLGGESYHLNAPFLCSSPETAASFHEAPPVKETLLLGAQAQVALVGIGSAGPKYSGSYLSGYATMGDLQQLQRMGAIGDVCGIYFDIHGRAIGGDFGERCITINKRDLRRIPSRIGLAGGPGKAEPILGALRGGYVNALVTDGVTARKVLELAGHPASRRR